VGRLDLRLPSDSPVETIDRLDRCLMAVGVHVIADQTGFSSEKRSARLLERC
jgi:hypothetical protein